MRRYRCPNSPLLDIGAGISLDRAVRRNAFLPIVLPRIYCHRATGATNFRQAAANFCQTLQNENLQSDHDHVCRASDTFGSIIDVLSDVARFLRLQKQVR